jgi:predicted DNA-binding transcriptional regulator AlpA
MKKYNNYDELPLALCADDVAAVLGISRTNAYLLFHREDFPTLHIGKRLLVPRDKFIVWINNSSV